jgi:lysophospholipase L1-like esterase
MHWKRKLAFGLIPISVLLLIGELGARVIGTQECGSIVPEATDWESMVGSSRYLWKLEPGRHQLGEEADNATWINELGLRSSHLPADPRAPGEIRILVIGDSSVYGWGQPDGATYAEQLEEELEKNFIGRAFSVINLGVPGYSTEQSLRLLQDIGWSYEPELIIVHNIFSDANIDAFQDRDALALADPDPGGLSGLLQSSRLYCAAYMPWARFQAGMNQETTTNESGETVHRVLMPGIPTGQNAAARLEDIDQVIDLSRVPLDDYIENLETMRTQAESRGASMIVAPLAQEWDVGIWNVPMPEPTADQVLPWHPYREAQAEWATEKGVDRVFLPDVFAAAAEPKAELFTDNMHPSVVGAQIMAWAITDQVRQRPGLIGLTAGEVGPMPARKRRKNMGPGGQGQP